MLFLSKERMARVFVRDRAILVTGAASVMLNIISWILIAWRARTLVGQATVPLHYTIYFGVDWAGPWYQVFTPPLVGFVALLVNYGIVFAVHENRRFFAYAYALGTVVIELILLAASFFVILLNL